MSLEKIEDLVSGDPQLMKYFVEELANKNKLVEAFGIMKRNNLEKNISIECFDILKNVIYNEHLDESV